MTRVWLLLVPLFVLGCGTTPRPPVFVGQVAPLRGPGQAVGHSALQGVRLAVQETNKDEEKMGAPVVVLHANAASEAACRAEAIRLKQINQVTALLGGQDAREVLSLDQEGLPVVSPAGLRTAEMSKLVFLTGLSPTNRGQALAEFALSGSLHPPLATVPVALPDMLGGPLSLWGLGPLFAASKLAAQTPPLPVIVLADQRRQEFALAAGTFAKHFSQHVAERFPGQNVPSPVILPYDKDTQLTEHLKQLADEKPSVVFLAGDVTAAQKLRAAPGGTTVPLLFAGPEGSQAALLSGLKAGAGIVLATAWVADVKSEPNTQFLKKYQEVFGEPPDVHAALAYDGGRLLFEALRQCQGLYSNGQIREKLAEIKDFPMLTGSATFDESGQLRRPVFLVRLAQGKAHTVGRHDPK